MKIILRADVENLGSLGDVVEVKAGYGRNFLIPQDFAMLATPANLRAFELERKKLQTRMDEIRGSASIVAAKLEGFVLIISMRVGENDKLYGSVTTSMIGELLNEQDIEVDRHHILLGAPIRTLGEYPLRVRLHADIIPTFTVKIVSEDKSRLGEEAKEEAKKETNEEVKDREETTEEAVAE